MTAHTLTEARAALAATLCKRATTDEVARLIAELHLPLPQGAQRELDNLTEARAYWGYASGMNGDFFAVDDAGDQVQVFKTLFPEDSRWLDDAADAATLSAAAQAALVRLGFEGSAGEALRDLRTTHPRGGQHRLRKQLRFLRRFEQKLVRMEAQQRLLNATRQGKSRLAYLIDADQLSDAGLAFVAYLTARANRRSMFMLGGQSKAQDTLSQALEALLSADEAWAQIALVKPTVSVLTRCTSEQVGRLAGLFHRELAVAASELGCLWPTLPERMRAEMVMVKGIDSSAWNAYAGALNTMRSAWISAMLAAGLDEALDRYLPGKAPRLMAADVVWWSRSEGGELHEDTRMFGLLPHPWEVVAGAPQGRAEILDVAARENVDALASGWVGPRAPHDRERPEAEPALVHGVAVADPQLAVRLRRCGVFSAKSLKHVDDLPQNAELVGVMTERGTRRAPRVLGVQPGN